MAMWVIAVVGVGAVPVLLAGREPDHVAGPDLLDRAAPALRPAEPAVTISVWPSGCVCQAVRAPGSKVTLAPRDARRVGRLEQRIDADRAGEPFGRSLGRTAASRCV